MDYSMYIKYFNRAIKEYKETIIPQEEIEEILLDVKEDIDEKIMDKERNELALALGYLIGVHLEQNAKNKIFNGEAEAWKLIEKQIIWLTQIIKSVPNSGRVSAWQLGGLIGLSVLWNYEDIAELTYEYANKLFAKDLEFYAENKTHHVFMTCLYHKWKTGQMPPLFDILPEDHVYQRLLKHWNDSEKLEELLYEVCDFHIYSASDTPKKSKEILSFVHIPYDIYCIQMIREQEGLETPSIKHPLLQTALGHIPKERPGYDVDADEILQYVLQHEKVPDWQRIIR
ncbi:hypothetical protein [Paenibacillus sp. Aloe-11]|nr:hypothetical protein [Paenibacillus sp. Aloe-11]EHS57789.1 hypothetical protein WG8_2262 [Paenibacillus sp. Aloe-11]